MSMDDLKHCPRRYVILAERVEDGRVVEQSVTGESRAEELFERWDEGEQLCNLRVKAISAPMDDVTRHFEHDWPPTNNEPVTSDGADVFTSERGLTRRLLTFPPFDLRTVTLADGSRVDCIQSIDASEDTIVGVRGWVPIGCLKLRTSTRSRGSHAQLVTHASQRDPVVAPGGDAE